MEKYKAIIFKVFLLIGCTIFFYPTISDYVNNITQSKAIVVYQEKLSEFEGLEIERLKEQADEYNKKIAEKKDAIYSPDSIEGYEETLNPFNNGLMGYVIIEKIGVNLPIHHGVNEGVIQSGVGHLPGTSLPVGEKNTHSVISTHSGLPSAKLFTDLNKLQKGDEFVISTLNKDLRYRINQIITVLPNEVESLRIEEGKDYVTMFTCTPYGINTHRLLVRGERVENNIEDERKDVQDFVKQSIKINRIKIYIILLLFVIILITIIKDLIDIKYKKEKSSNEIKKQTN